MQMSERSSSDSHRKENKIVKNIRRDLRQIAWKDPIVILLCILLVFLTFGSTMSACSGASQNRVRIELDAAYGGSDTGYQGIVNEADVCQNIVTDLQALLKKDKRFQVLLSHEAGTSSSVSERAKKINQDNPLFVISIHADGNPNAALSGMHVYADIPSSKNHEASLRLAQAAANAFTAEDWPVSTGYLYYQPYESDGTYEMKFVSSEDTSDYQLDTLALMKQCDMPVIVTNQFYVTNETDVSTWANEDGYQKAAQKLYYAICDYNGLERRSI
jgi:N-acetylmuramoyl-L-alanine amidase